jgi:hypothetical protein
LPSSFRSKHLRRRDVVAIEAKHSQRWFVGHLKQQRFFDGTEFKRHPGRNGKNVAAFPFGVQIADDRVAAAACDRNNAVGSAALNVAGRMNTFG